MSEPAPDVSIVIVSWNTRALVLECLESLPAATGGLSSEVLLIDNGSSDGTADAVRRAHPGVRVLGNEVNGGFAAANNQGIRTSRGRYVLLLNSDTRPRPEAIVRMVAWADSRPRAGCVGAMLLHPDGRFQASFQDAPGVLSECLSAAGIGRRLWFEGYPGYGPTESQERRQVDVIPGACMLLRRAALDQTGLLDESFFMYSEETDLCWRLRAAGWEVWYIPEARVVHLGGQSTQQVRSSMVRALYRSKVRYVHLHHGGARALALRLLLLVILSMKWVAAQAHPAARRRVPRIGWRDLDPRGVGRAGPVSL